MSAVEIGRVLGPHGLGGELKVRLHWRGSTTLDQAKRVLVAGRPCAVESVRVTPRGVLLKLAGIDDRDAAFACRGALVAVERDALPPLAPGEFYLSDLLGAEVHGPDGKLGEVVEVRTHPSVDSIAVRLLDGRVLEQPLSAPWLDEVDLEARRIVLSSSEGMV